MKPTMIQLLLPEDDKEGRKSREKRESCLFLTSRVHEDGWLEKCERDRPKLSLHSLQSLSPHPRVLTLVLRLALPVMSCRSKDVLVLIHHPSMAVNTVSEPTSMPETVREECVGNLVSIMPLSCKESRVWGDRHRSSHLILSLYISIQSSSSSFIALFMKVISIRQQNDSLYAYHVLILQSFPPSFFDDKPISSRFSLLLRIA